MSGLTWKIVALGAVAPGAAMVWQQPDSSAVQLQAVRFYRAPGTTLVDLFGRIALRALSPLPGTGAEDRAAFRVAFAVRDSAGLTLVSRSWSRSVPARLLSLANSSTVEHVSFAAQPGRYSVELTVTDSASGRVTTRSTEIETYPAAPAASDLLLASGMRAASGSDTAPGDGEIRKGATLLRASGAEVLTPRQARLAYYLELYPTQAETAQVAMRVVREDGSTVVAAPPSRVPLAAGGGVLEATMDLSGLPPGRYQLEAVSVGPDSTVTRSAAFSMAGFETENTLASVAASNIRGPFDSMTEAQLDSAYDPLVYVMRSDEQGIFSSLTLQGKRHYLDQFWARRDPTPGTAANEEQQAFYARIAEANRRFAEGGASEIPGWRTDRGRIFIRYGAPDDVLERPQAGSTAPYVVWKYTRTRALKFVFLDVTRFGNYSLIYTNDRHEVSRPDWQSLLGPEAVIDVDRF